MKRFTDYLRTAPPGVPQCLGAFVGGMLALILDLANLHVGSGGFRLSLVFLTGWVVISGVLALVLAARGRRGA